MVCYLGQTRLPGGNVVVSRKIAVTANGHATVLPWSDNGITAAW